MALLFSVPPTQAQSADAGWHALFAYHDPYELLTEREEGDIVLLATGDVLLARSINQRMVQTNDFLFPFVPLAPLLKQADITWVNLETPIVAECRLRDGGLRFCGNPPTIAGLVYAGVDVANLANNHTENYGEDGVYETVDHLTAANIAVTGLAQPLIMEVHNKKIGLLGFNDASGVNWINGAKPAFIEAQVAALRPQVDYLIVGFHWGQEYKLIQNKRQRALAQTAIDAGADAVIGHHPHWLQGVELYKEKPIFYSLGNFIFDQASGGWVTDGAMALLRFDDAGHLTVRLIPVIIEDQSTPRLATPEEAADILQRIASVSRILEDVAD